MKIKHNLSFRLISFLTLSTFILHSFLFSSFSYAEVPCWNDGSINSIVGGSDTLSAVPAGNPNPQGTEKAADPVNLATGNYYYEHTDFTIPSRGLALEFKRFYNSQDDYDGPFGIGTSHNYNIFLIEATDGEASYVIRRNPDGNKDKFIKNTDGTYTAPAGVFEALFKTQDGYTITTKQGITYRFNLLGYLSSITDRNQNQLSLTYDANTGVLTKITDTLGREIFFSYTNERKISAITDFTGRTWQFGYQDNDLISVTTPPTQDFPRGSTTTYAYQSHNLSSITDARGNTYLNIIYDDQDRVDKMTYGLGTYDFNYSNKLTTLYEPKGNRIDYSLNDDGTTNKKIQYISNANLETNYAYNSDKLVTKVIYPKGNSTLYEYDAQGNLSRINRKPKSNSLASDITTTFTYEPRFNLIKTIDDPRGNTTTYYYDYEEAALGDLNGDAITNQANGNLVKIIYPINNNQTPETKFTYNTYGQVLTVTDPNGNITQYEYSPTTGYLTKIINASGVLDIATEMTYDTLGNVLTIKDPKVNTTSFEYDSHNNLTKTTSASPFSYVTEYKYDANDNLIQIDRQTDDTNNPWQSTYYTYDVLDRLQSIKDELDNTTSFSYDVNGNRSQIKDAELNTTNYDYDERNLLWKVTDALNNITEYTYDTNGNLEKLKDAKANLTTYTYDDFERLVKTTYADGSPETYSYDANSNLISKTQPQGQTIYYDYDSLNRLKEKGLIPKGTVPDSVVTYFYDNGSRLTSVTDTQGAISYAYDTANRITQVTYPGTKSIAYEYDNNSNRSKLTYPDVSFITYEYDQLNRLTNLKDQAEATLASYQYDALSRRTQLSYANNTSTTYTYDAINRLTNLKGLSPQGTVPEFSYTYDKVGNRKTLTTSQGIHNYTYDKIYQLTAADYPQGFVFPDTTFNYDSVGNRISTLNGGTTNYTTNSLNQYTNVGITNSTYDANGNLTSDGANTYTYDYENRLLQATSSTLQANYKYDAFGRRTEKTVNGTTIKFLYDGDQIIAEYDASGNLQTKYIYGPGIDEPIKGLSPTGTVPEWYYHYDGLGSVTNLTNSTGSTVESYTYDIFGKPNTTSNLGNRFMFTGREYDSETGLYYYRARYYSPTLGRFLQRDPVGYVAGINLYAYCFNDPINFVDPLGLDVIVLNDPRGAYKQGHQAAAIGDDQNGWDYYSKDGFGQDNRHIRYNSELEMLRGIDETGNYTNKGERYTNSFRIRTSPDQDQNMLVYANRHYNEPYLLPGRHCGDLVTGILESGGIPIGSKPFMNQPNKAFENIVRANTPQDDINAKKRKK